MRLYLIRHPRPSAFPDVCYGQSDVPVSSASLDASLKALLSNDNLPGGLPVYSSPLTRSAALAEALTQAWQVSPPIYDARLMEMNFGGWEMRAWTDIPRSEVDAWVADLAQYRPGGGESVMDMAARVLSFKEELQARGQDACVVCHAGTIRLLMAANGRGNLHQMALTAARERVYIGYGQMMVLYT
jgi:Fructose-2,6-bisphosphatase